jgi:hypothetical protein
VRAANALGQNWQSLLAGVGPSGASHYYHVTHPFVAQANNRPLAASTGRKAKGDGMRPAWLKEKEEVLRRFFDLSPDLPLCDEKFVPHLTDIQRANLQRFNLEWHLIPPAEVVPMDETYINRLYPLRPGSFDEVGQWEESCAEALRQGHARHQGRVICIETTLKPSYLPHDQQSYGTRYGFDQTKDPFRDYMGRAELLTSTRYGHSYTTLRRFVTLVNEEWQARGWLPPGYRFTFCPPAVFNLVGTLFHPEWSDTESLELGFYRDAHGNAHCFAVGSNAPGDFSYISPVELESEWTLLGFRAALVID